MKIGSYHKPFVFRLLAYFCAMRQIFSVVFMYVFLANTTAAQAQDDVWTLQRSVQYALEHNISIRQNALNERLAKLTLQQSRLSQIPSVNANTSYGRSYGRSVDPTTNQFVKGSYDYLSVGGNADVLLFGWFQRRNQIAANKYSLEASRAELDQLKDDVSLNVATGYLRALLAQEQIRVNEKQVDLSKAQLSQTEKFVNAGRLPELNVAQLQSQLASDSASLINAIATYNSAILDMKALLNLDFSVPFEIRAPAIDATDEMKVASLRPEDIYLEAKKHFGAIRSNELRLQASGKSIDAAHSALWPQLTLNAQLGTSYASTYTEVTGLRLTGSELTPAYAQGILNADTFNLPIFQPTYEYSTRRIPLGTQLDNNFRQTISIGVNIPIFNGWQSQYALRQARISYLNQELNRDQAELKLKQDVYKAYSDALSAIQKYNAADRAVVAARRAFVFADKRYQLGLTNTVEYLIIQNNQFVAEANELSAKYDLIFKLKVIDYYLGNELKL
jgi:outer membrane protein